MNTTATLRTKNMLEILKIVRSQPSISRPEIAERAKLTSVTVSTLIAELLKRKIVVEEGLADSKGGRKACVYSFNKDASRIIGINITPGRITIELFDLVGNSVTKGVRLHPKKDQPVEETVYSLIRTLKKFLVSNGMSEEDVLAIGLTVPGRVDHENGIVYNLPNLKQWKNVPIKALIEGELKIPLFLERDTNSNILYLKWDEYPDEKANMAYVSITEGLGAGILIDDNVYHGEHGLAGEAGHTTINPDGGRCNCGNIGCIELYASNPAIVKNYFSKLAANGRDVSESDAVIGDMEAENAFLALLVQRAKDGDTQAHEALTEATKYLETFFVNIVNSYDPGLLIVDCEWMRLGRRYFNEAVSGMFDRIRFISRNDIKVVLSPDMDIFSKSPYIVVIERLFTDLNDNILFLDHPARYEEQA